LSYIAASGGSKEAASGSKKTLQEVKDSVKFASSSKEEEEFIKNFIAEAEKDSKH
jgi:F-type H+-transporting ATPase subunit k